MPTRPNQYQFGEWRLDSPEHLLQRNGIPVSLTPKVFQTLVLLVENAGRLVSKDEFMRRVWPDTFVEDVALAQNISQLRKVLGSGNGEEPMIETVPKQGYRFLAPVRRIGAEAGEPLDEPAGTGELSATPRLTDASGRPPKTAAQPIASGKIPAQLAPRRGARSWLPYVLPGVLLIAGGAAAIFSVWNRGPALAETDKIILADFENQTGDPSFDHSLNQALKVKLSESPYLNVVTDAEIPAPLRRGLAACGNTGARALLQSEIQPMGDGYRIALTAWRCPDGKAIAKAEVNSATREGVLAAVGTAADDIRLRLGEAASVGRQFHAPVEQATSSSLAALRAFSLGEEKRALGQDYESIPFYKVAVDLDPGFALPYARLGIIYGNAQQPGFARMYFQKAFDLRARGTERERLYITAHYYGTTGEAEKELDVYRMWREIYPRDVIPANNLVNVYLILGQPGKALESSREARKLAPDHGVVYASAMQALQCNGQFAEAKALFDETVRRGLDGFLGHLVRLFIASAENDEAEVNRQVAWARGNPRESEMLEAAAVYVASTGRVRSARGLFQRAEILAMQGGSKELAGKILLSEAGMEAEYGFSSRARAQAKRALPLLTEAKGLQALVALTMSEAGDLKQAENITSRLQEGTAPDTRLRDLYLPPARAAIMFRHGELDEAIAQLRVAQPYDLSLWLDFAPVYYRGSAQSSLHHYAEAITEFRKILDHRAISPDSPYVALASVGLARAYLAQHETGKAQAAFEELLSHWARADADLPLVRDTRIEYARILSPQN